MRSSASRTGNVSSCSLSCYLISPLATGGAVGDVMYSARELMPSRPMVADDGVTALAVVEPGAAAASVVVCRLSDVDCCCCCCGFLSSLASSELSNK